MKCTAIQSVATLRLGNRLSRGSRDALSRVAASLLALCGVAAPATAQTFSLDWFTIDNGGGRATGGAYELAGTIGQPEAGRSASSDGAYELVGGFWPGWPAGSCAAPCPGDLDGSCAVELADLARLLAHFGVPSGATLADGDVDGDGDVDLDDLSRLLANFGRVCN